VALCMLFPFVDLVLKGLESALHETSESLAYSPGVLNTRLKVAMQK